MLLASPVSTQTLIFFYQSAFSDPSTGLICYDLAMFLRISHWSSTSPTGGLGRAGWNNGRMEKLAPLKTTRRFAGASRASYDAAAPETQHADFGSHRRPHLTEDVRGKPKAMPPTFPFRGSCSYNRYVFRTTARAGLVLLPFHYE
jgi:hypothetical protein